MEDLTKKLENLLNSPDGMEKIRSAMAALGPSAQPPEPAAPETEEGGALPDLSGLLAAFNGGGASKPAASAGDTGGGLPDLSMLTRLAPLLSNLRRDDENTILLKALRPYLHGDREKRLDDAIKIMQFIRVMPLLRERGLF